MTTKVIIACPDNSAHDAIVYVEQRNGTDGIWTRTSAPTVIAPREQAPPIYLTSTQRVVIEEAPHERAEQQPA